MKHSPPSSRSISSAPIGVISGPRAFLETEVAAERMRHDKDVGEQDRGIEAETADRLQRHLDGEVGIVAEVEETSGALSRLTVLGKVAAGLAHHPDGRRKDRLSIEHVEHDRALPGIRCHPS